MGNVIGTHPCPPRFLMDANGAPTTTENPAFTKWKTQGQTLLSWFFASLTEPVLAQIVGFLTAKDV